MTAAGAVLLAVIVVLLIGAGAIGLPRVLRQITHRAGQRWDARPNPHHDHDEESQ